ncbi:MAG: hypothetical protein WBF89_18030 [Steroidobacteraceae bacterium]|jgi:hypothetical protein
MQQDFSQIGPFLFAALVVFAIYRRFRRNFGRQPLRPARMTLRIVLLTVVVCLLLPAALRSAQFLSAELAGAALGIALGVWGAQRTRFLMFGGRLHYVPHTYTGIAVSLLFLGRLAFRLMQVYGGAHAAHLANAATAAAPAADPSQAFAPASMVRSPLTVGIFFVLAGYYLCYYGWVLWKSKHLEAADIEADPSAPSQ